MKLRQIGSNQTEVVINGAKAPAICDHATDITVLFSYQTPVALFASGVGAFRTAKRWSVTTSRHINKWVAENGFSGAVEINQETLDNLCSEVK